MPTSAAGIPTPALTDAVNAPSQMQAMATALQLLVVGHFASAAARSAAYTAVSYTAQDGELTWRADASGQGGLEKWDLANFVWRLVATPTTRGTNAGSFVSSTIVVTHGLGTTPSFVTVTCTQPTSANEITYRVTSMTATTFTVLCYVNGVPAGTATAAFMWKAEA